VRVIVAIVAVPRRRVQRKVDNDAIPLYECRRKFPRRREPLLMAKFVRQRQNDVPAGGGCRPAR